MDRNSVQAWRRVKNDGKLTEARRRALRGVVRFGPCTAQELVKATRYQHAEKRLSELERAGIVRRCEPRACAVTGETAWQWQINPEPVAITEPVRPSQTARIKALEAAVDVMRQQLLALRRPNRSPPDAVVFDDPRQGELFTVPESPRPDVVIGIAAHFLIDDRHVACGHPCAAIKTTLIEHVNCLSCLRSIAGRQARNPSPPP